jgi:hypothetical protein
MKLCNIATQQELATLEPLPSGCLSLRFSPDGCALAVGTWLSPDLYLSLWQVPSFEQNRRSRIYAENREQAALNQAREEALFTSALEVLDRLMTDSHDKQQLQAAPEGVDAICDVCIEAWIATSSRGAMFSLHGSG